MTPQPSTAARVEAALRQCENREKAAFFPRFFKAHPGGYGEGDKFLGVVVPDQRRIAKLHRDLPPTELGKLLGSPWHECRLTGLLILVDQYRRGDQRRHEEKLQFYLDQLPAVNNWDLVDSSAPYIVGAHVAQYPARKTLLTQLAATGELWRERVAIVATLTLIRGGVFEPTKRLARTFLTHEHDLMHKATGWMLREMGKRDQDELLAFLDRHTPRMPRTMLRYALERLPEPLRKHYMSLPTQARSGRS